MDFKNVMLVPQGRLDPATFQKAALILIGIGFALSLLQAISFVFAVLGILSLALIYPWIVVWVKRLHDAGMSGWWLLAIIVAYAVVAVIVGQIINSIFVDQAAMEAAAASGDIFGAMMTASRAAALPNAIASAVISVAFVFVANMVLKSDPGPNPYGPPYSG